MDDAAQEENQDPHFNMSVCLLDLIYVPPSHLYNWIYDYSLSLKKRFVPTKLPPSLRHFKFS